MSKLLTAFATRAIILASLLGFLSFSDSSTHDEPDHLASGIYDWHTGGFDLYYVNPPLTRMLAALPASFVIDGSQFAPLAESGSLTNWGGGAGSFLWSQGPRRGEWWLSIGRLMLIPVMLLGLWSTESLARDLYGSGASHFAGWLYVISPTLLTAGHSVAADGSCAAFLTTSCLMFTRWLASPTIKLTLLSGFTLGAALLTKTLMIILPCVFLVYAIANIIMAQHDSRIGTRRSVLFKLVAMMLVACFVLNSMYGFRGSFIPLANYRFLSNSLTGHQSLVQSDGLFRDVQHRLGNRFEKSWIGNLPVPLPELYVYGIDRQKCDLERGIPFFLNGRWKKSSWIDHVVSLLVKIPVGIQLIIMTASVVQLGKLKKKTVSRKEMALTAVLFSLVAVNFIHTGLTTFFRYLTPCFPLGFVLCSCVATPDARQRSIFGMSLRQLSVCFLFFATACVLISMPHVVAYNNLWIGGPWRKSQNFYMGTNEYGQNLWRLLRQLEDFGADSQLYICDSYRNRVKMLTGKELGHIPSVAKLHAGLTETSSRTVLRPGWYVSTSYDAHPPVDSIGNGFLAKWPPDVQIAPGLCAYYICQEDIEVLWKVVRKE